MCMFRQFQFHKGAIRTLVGIVGCTLCLEFQFHKGAIRTNRLQHLQTVQDDFNSIKVRLELFQDLIRSSSH